ncbi:FAD:protein FMN transferase [Hymenobacter taeanensis]|uniref:FAD:protein FMN transferase n=1 Tax=Hymenobacter taeanensis TaxID=2735321 RepID=A0A6M6BD57_9BACT|nr:MULTISPECIES: FAD:protein FMN transferase [Hymenobacter]QJX45674.1 FAD:protein FMN transferase [Hymenobacter taeanensis]UOQ79510.1 FAD:protein FMN transferase [Hymenobacter sp. 5414T-23]
MRTSFGPFKLVYSALGQLLVLGWLLVASGAAFAQAPAGKARNFTRNARLMGSHFSFTAVSKDDSLAWRAIRAGIRETQRIDRLFSYWDSTSQITQVNRQAGIKPVVVDQEVYDLIQRTLKLSALSNGAFDITFAGGEKIYKFDRKEHAGLPAPEVVKASVARIDYRKVLLDPATHSVMLQDKGMRMNLAGILQGYGVRKAQALMRQMGIQGGLINGSGDVSCWGRQSDGSLWRIAIGDPVYPQSVSSWLTVTDVAVVTAGNYEQYFTVQGKYYGHIIDPHTGYPATGLRSVTIICPDVELADGLDEVVFVKGPEEGLAFINKLKGVDCTLITNDGRTLASRGMAVNYYSTQQPQTAAAPTP